MDGLALLCALHADGPATLKRLRGVGCSDLEAFLARSTDELVRLLEVTPAHARRLRREADLLRERVSGGLLLQEEESAPIASREEIASADAELSSVDRVLLGRVLEHWRERDATRDAAAPEREPEPELAREPELGAEIESDASEEPDESDDALAPELVAGLTAELVAALAEVEIRTLGDLADADPDALAAELAIPFSEVRRVQFLVRKLADARASRARAADPTGASDAPSTRESAADARERTLLAPPSVDAPASPRPPPPSRARALRAGDAPFGAGIETDAERDAPQWNFEIPRPAPLSAAERETSGGPFA